MLRPRATPHPSSSKQPSQQPPSTSSSAWRRRKSCRESPSGTMTSSWRRASSTRWGWRAAVSCWLWDRSRRWECCRRCWWSCWSCWCRSGTRRGRGRCWGRATLSCKRRRMRITRAAPTKCQKNRLKAKQGKKRNQTTQTLNAPCSTLSSFYCTFIFLVIIHAMQCTRMRPRLPSTRPPTNQLTNHLNPSPPWRSASLAPAPRGPWQCPHSGPAPWPLCVVSYQVVLHDILAII